MKRPRRVDLVVLLGSVLPAALALPACGTDEVEPDQMIISSTPADATQGGLLVGVAPGAATFDQVQADGRAGRYEPGYHVLLDGRELAWDDTYVVRPIVLSGGGTWGAGFYDAGTYRLAVVAPGGAAVAAVDAVVVSGGMTHLYVFGALDAREARVVTYASTPPAGKVHVSAINMVRSGDVRIEVVACTGAPATCAPVSPVLGFGDTFDADLDSGATSSDGASSLSATGAGYGYRQVATASLPAPPVIPMPAGAPPTSADPGAPPALFVAAPIYMAPDGTILQSSI